jgi:voltage-gated sodium channel
MTMSYPENKRRKKAMQQADKKDNRLSDAPDDVVTPLWRVECQRVVASQAFQGAVFFLIFSNTLFLGYEVNEVAQSPSDSRPLGFLVVDGIYTAFFLMELLFRGMAEGCRSFWCSADKHWNIFDVVVIATSVMELLAPLLVMEQNSTMDLSWLRTFRFIRITRLLRTLRIVRLVRFIRSLRTLLHSIVYTLRSVFWALLLMLMIFYGFGVAFTQAVGDYRTDQDKDVNKSDKPDEKERWTIERDILDKYWRDLPTSMFTLFQSVTSGINWGEAVIPLRNVGSMWVWFFIFFIVFMVWVVVNVITGFFCQSAIESAQHDMDLATAQLISKWQENKKFLESIFNEMDSDNSGQVTLKELEACLENEQMQAYLSSLGIEAVDAWTLLKLLDVNESGTVELEEFILGCMQLRGGAKAVHVARLAYDQRQMNTVLEEFIAHVNVQLAAVTSTLSSGPLLSSVHFSGIRSSNTSVAMAKEESHHKRVKEEQANKREPLFSI